MEGGCFFYISFAFGGLLFCGVVRVWMRWRVALYIYMSHALNVSARRNIFFAFLGWANWG